MLRGFYSAGLAMMAQSRRMDVITNNLVNSDTVGYKMETMTTRSFEDVLISRLNDPSIYQYQDVGPYTWGVHVDQTHVSFQEGSFQETENSTDLALQGEGFFVVSYMNPVAANNEDLADETEAEDRYIRAGNFAVDNEGYLVTPNGYYVQGTDMMPIQVGTMDFDVDIEGNIFVDDELVGTLRVVRFEDNTVLRKTGDNLFTVYQATDEYGDADYAAMPEDITGTVRQYFLESSNVDVARETVRMMETYRAYEINQKIINIFDESLGLTVNEIARI